MIAVVIVIRCGSRCGQYNRVLIPYLLESYVSCLCWILTYYNYYCYWCLIISSRLLQKIIYLFIFFSLFRLQQ